MPGWFPSLYAKSSSFTAVGLMTGPDFVNSVFIFLHQPGEECKLGKDPRAQIFWETC